VAAPACERPVSANKCRRSVTSGAALRVVSRLASLVLLFLQPVGLLKMQLNSEYQRRQGAAAQFL
jgi:hypothetical protein